MISKRFAYDSKSILKLNSTQKRAKELIETKIKSGQYQTSLLNCPVCKSTEKRTLGEKDRYGLPHKTVICIECGLIYSNPQMKFESYAEFYDSEYRNLYVGSEHPTELFFQRQEKKGAKIFQYIVDSKIKQLEPGTKILEIGCGAGGILHFFKKKGCTTKGLDLGGEYLNYGINNYQLDLTKGSILDLDLDFKPDIIIYSHVLEHITDLIQELKNIKKILSEDSLLYIEIPGVKRIHKNYKMDFLLYLQNAHTFYFSLTSLNNLMVKNQFKLIKGNEEVQSIFKIDSTKNEVFIINDYTPVLKYIQKYEGIRIYYPLSITNIKFRIHILLKSILQFIGIKDYLVNYRRKNKETIN